MSLSLLHPIDRMEFPISMKWYPDFLSSMCFHFPFGSFTSPPYYFPGSPGLKCYLQLNYAATGKNDREFKIQCSLIFDTKYKNTNASGNFIFAINGKKFAQRGFEFENYGLHELVGFKDAIYIFGQHFIINLKGSLFIKHISPTPIQIKVDKIIRNLFKNHDGKDFVVYVNDKELNKIKQFKIHKSILQKYSTFFESLFYEKEKDCMICGFNYKIVKIALNLCYGITPKFQLYPEEFIQLLKFADTFGMEYIKIVIKKSIALTPNNICDYTIFAYDYHEFFDECLNYLNFCAEYNYPINHVRRLKMHFKRLFKE
uniref:BTB domain-containing protein n=1 Tax=Panagrolaimus sp. PS1159 TaxID=55785 RepID=A0AC35GBC3_9BILA